MHYEWCLRYAFVVENENIGVTYFDLYASLNRKLGTVLSSTYISSLRHSSLHKAQMSFDEKTVSSHLNFTYGSYMVGVFFYLT